MSSGKGVEKFVVVTGGSGGIGEAIARIFSPAYTIILHYHNSVEKAQRIKADLLQKGGKVHIVKADLTSEEGCKNFYDSVSNITSRIDILVNNSGGVIKRHAIKEISWELMQRYFELNTFSTIQISALFVPLLEKGEDPSIINISSGSIRLGSPNNTLYAASKGAVDVFTRGMANELAPRIRVNSVAPGVIGTEFHRATPEDLMEKLKTITPLKRIGTAKEVAHTVQFLAMNTFITGETIDLNGGLSMR